MSSVATDQDGIYRAVPRVRADGTGLAIASHVTRQALRWALIWGTVFGLFVIATIQAYVKAYPTLAERLQLTRSLRPFVILLGVPRHAETVAGFTTWRVLIPIAIIGAIWGLRTSTGLLRGEEEAGRWELLRAGPTTNRQATAQALIGLAVVLTAMFLMTALLILAAGRLPGARFSFGGSLLFATNLVSGAAIFLSVGALASQIAATRGQASMLSAVVLGMSFVVRVIADSQTSQGWLRWLTPLGWIEELHPLRDVQPIALLPVVALTFVCAVLSVVLAGRRDLYGSILGREHGHGAAAWWLAGPVTLALRVTWSTSFGWLLAVAAFSAMLGSVARASVSLTVSSPAITAALGRFGIHTAIRGYLGFALFFVSVLLALLAASQIDTIRDEEASGRLDNLLVQPLPRVTWLASRLAVSVVLVALGGIVAGLSAWAGAASHHIFVPLPTMLQAGLNATIPGIFVLGIGTLVLGTRPRLAAVWSYAVVAWSFLIDLLGSLVKGVQWLRDTSLFAHISLAPAENPDWGTAALIVALGLVAGVIGAIAFQKRDVSYQ